MPAVSNTSPILNPAVIRQLDLLPQEFGEVFIPGEVLGELKLDKQLPGTPAIQSVLEAGWLQVRTIHNPVLKRALESELDRGGEAATITLALKLGIETILLDERDGRAKAKHLGLRPVVCSGCC